MRSVFFFSSRRRHTRSYGDWSSDVCSSDLFATVTTSPPSPRSAGRWRSSPTTPSRARISRSEERRVGKECRSRWGGEQLKKKDRIEGRHRDSKANCNRRRVYGANKAEPYI